MGPPSPTCWRGSEGEDGGRPSRNLNGQARRPVPRLKPRLGNLRIPHAIPRFARDEVVLSDRFSDPRPSTLDPRLSTPHDTPRKGPPPPRTGDPPPRARGLSR